MPSVGPPRSGRGGRDGAQGRAEPAGARPTRTAYFAVPGALILDNRLANAVHDLSGLRRLVSSAGRSRPWTPYRYAVYLQWMRQTAAAAGVEPELLEITIFQPPGDIADEHDAAD